MKRASYKDGIKWIAFNDEPEETEIPFVKYQISTMLLADLFQVDPEKVAIDIIFERNKNLAKV